MKNTILIVANYSAQNSQVIFDARIYAQQSGGNLQLITNFCHVGTNSSLWDAAKIKVEKYFNNPEFLDGAYTAFMQDLQPMHPKQEKTLLLSNNIYLNCA